MTVKLYDNDSYASEFYAEVKACEQINDKFRVILDRTLFFPEEGGQCCDKGKLNGIDVTDVTIEGDTIYHFLDEPLEVHTGVFGQIDTALRFRNMQNHSGEHIICGIANKLFGYNNVGFHLGQDSVTMDLDGELTDEDIINIELLANEAIYKNMPVTAYYPDEEELDSLTYRAKGEIDGKVRIVIIGDVDSCACCAPHVKSTGEIGIIKIVDSMRHRGGMRLTIVCGKDALNDYALKHSGTVKISNLLSVKQSDITSGVEKLLSDIAGLKTIISDKTKQIAKLVSDSVEESDKNICLFCDGFEPEHLRLASNEIKNKTKACSVVLSGNDTEGYKYVMAVADGDVMPYVKEANLALSGRGGGKGNMASGSFGASKEEIVRYFSS